jgi:hypothetical protein
VFGSHEGRQLRAIREDVELILRILRGLKSIDFKQIGASDMPTNFSIVAGTNGSFSAVLNPLNGAMASGSVPHWTSSDPNVILVPSSDGLLCDAAVPVGFAAASFDLSIAAASSDPNLPTLTNMHTISVSPAAPPPPTPLTAIDFAQTA